MPLCALIPFLSIVVLVRYRCLMPQPVAQAECCIYWQHLAQCGASTAGAILSPKNPPSGIRLLEHQHPRPMIPLHSNCLLCKHTGFSYSASILGSASVGMAALHFTCLGAALGHCHASCLSLAKTGSWLVAAAAAAADPCLWPCCQAA